mmetsp:Transcript_32721/g.92822  ORF Transcript_32721/g.92822 Transcript_32721/m.92822 type:complete len:121 (-) Transcript_32721:85-447(-)
MNPGADQYHRPWRKVLHAAQPYPDNHTDESFLEHLVLNLNVQPRRYWDVVYGTTIIVQQLSIVAAAVAVPLHLHEGRISVQCLMLLNVLMVLSGMHIPAAYFPPLSLQFLPFRTMGSFLW